MTKIVFGGGTKIETSADAKGIVELLGAVASGKRADDHGQPLPIGYAALHTDHGPVYVNASEVAYVHD